MRDNAPVVDAVPSFLVETEARRLLGPVAARVPASALFGAFEAWSTETGRPSLSQTAFGRALAASPLVQPGRQRAGKFYVATPALHALWTGGEVPAALGGQATSQISVLGVEARPTSCEVLIRAARGGTPFSVVGLVHSSVFAAHQAVIWCMKRPQRLGNGPQFRAYVTPFELPLSDQRLLDARDVAPIMAPELFEGEVT